MMTSLRIFVFAITICFANTVNSQPLSVPSDGKDFYIGYANPSYNTVANASTGSFYGASLLISTYTDNNVTVWYFDRNLGSEVMAGRYRIPARTGIQIPLDLSHVMTDTSETPQYCAVHVTADRPINVEFFSTGACSGGSFLALQTQVLGKKYVVASYNNNDGTGGLLGGFLGPTEIEVSHGFFEIIAAYDSTKVTITPNATTMGGHVGVNSGVGSTGVPKPYTVKLRRGQCYMVKAARDDVNTDISGSIIESDKPVAVIAGQENAFLGGVSGRSLEGRDFMVEQMIPVDYWDTTGYVSIPLKDSQPADSQTYQGVGETYRVYTYDSSGSQIQFYDQCAGNPSPMPVGRYAHPVPERIGITCHVDFKATNGHTFSVMMFDERNFANAAPYPAPSMMTIIPISHWRTSYLWYVPVNKFETLQAYYVNIIAPAGDLDAGIKVSFNGGPVKPLKQVLSLEALYKIIPNHPELNGARFKLYPGSYYATGPHPFMVYNYGFRAIDPDFDLGDFEGDNFFFSYASPAGIKTGNGSPHFRVMVDTSCSSWNVCIHDSTFDGGIRSVTLLDDPTGDYVKPGRVFKNVRLDDSLDPGYPGFNKNEINYAGNDADVCFKVNVNSPIDSAYAPLFIADVHGNAILVELKYQPPVVRFDPDSGRYFKVLVNKDSCSRFPFYNVGKGGLGKSFNFTSANLIHKNPAFKITSISPKLPAFIKPGDSLVITACFTARDTSLQSDTINLVNDCFSQPIDLVGKGAAPLIIAGNRDFGAVIVDSTKCDTVSIRNVGDAPFTLTTSWVLDNFVNFRFADSAMLPLVLKPGQIVYLTFCYTPHDSRGDTAIMHWGTNLIDPYKHSIKDTSILRGRGVKTGFVWDRTLQEFYVDSGNSVDSVIERVYLYNSAIPGPGVPSVHIDSVFILGPDAPEFYILANQFGYSPLKNVDLKPGDSIWVDVVFKPDLTKFPRYANRYANLIAKGNNEKDQIINLIGTWAKSSVDQPLKAVPFSIHPNPVTGRSVIISFASLQESKSSLRIYDVLGREVYKTDILQGMSQLKVPIQNLPKGTYFARLTSGNSVSTQKFEIIE